jgi:hypothetical protein
MEMGPVLVVNFQAQQIAYIADASGKVVEGDPVSSSDSYSLSPFHVVCSIFRNKSIELTIFLHWAVIQPYLIRWLRGVWLI